MQTPHRENTTRHQCRCMRLLPGFPGAPDLCDQWVDDPDDPVCPRCRNDHAGDPAYIIRAHVRPTPSRGV